MMPSRGLHLARLCVPRRPNQGRSISIASSNLTRPLRAGSQPLTRQQPWQHASPSSLRLAFGIRLASTKPIIASTETSNAQITTTPPAPADAATPALSSIDTITIDNIDFSLNEVSEQVGDLAKIGVDFGYGITSTMQWVLENYHSTIGLPWWASIAATALTVRILQIPLTMKASNSVARQAALSSVTAPIQKRMTDAQAAGDKVAMQQIFQELMQTRKQAGIRFRDQLAPMFIQGVLGYCGYRLIWKMAHLPVPGLVNGGFSWLTDLTVSDPYLLLPIMMGVSMHIVGRMGGESGVGAAGTTGAENTEVMRKLMLHVLPVGVTLIMAWQSAALAVWFAASGLFAVIQTFAFRNPNVRRRLGMVPMYKPNPADAKNNNIFTTLINGGSDASAEAATTATNGIRYQPPKLQSRTADGKIIDIVPTKMTTGEAVEEKPKPGVLGQIKDRYYSLKEQQTKKMAKKAQQSAVSARKSKAQAYEDRHQQMGRQ